LALPEVTEQDHHGRPSFRVAGRIFSTLWDERHMNVMLDEPGIRTAVRDWPAVCEEFWWGKRLGAVHVNLARADEALASELLADAWEQKAPKRLLTNRDAKATRAAPRTSDRALELAPRFGLGEDDLEAWERSGLGDDAFDDWLTDRVARRPTGRRAREVYGADDVHDFARRAVLGALELRSGERLLEIGCGGGLLLRDALAAGASATGLDHSEEMVELARERAPGAEVVLGDAHQLPFRDGSFDAVAMSVVFIFLSRPLVVLRECRRVLAPGGRIAIYTTSSSLRGTPAAPEPLAGRSHFYENEQLAALAERAGYANVVVRDDNGGQLLTASTRRAQAAAKKRR
jgi:ubiquinone/menaquinone biosynthesis C-methylase UbiE